MVKGRVDDGEDAGGEGKWLLFLGQSDIDRDWLLQGGIELVGLVDGVPVDDVPPGVDVFWAPIEVLQVIGVLPDIESQNGNHATVHQWIV